MVARYVIRYIYILFMRSRVYTLWLYVYHNYTSINRNTTALCVCVYSSVSHANRQIVLIFWKYTFSWEFFFDHATVLNAVDYYDPDNDYRKHVKK